MANMDTLSNLDVLAAVASQRLLDLSNSELQSEKLSSFKRKASNPKKNSRRNYSNDELCAMSHRELINKFTSTVHDEMKRKFSYTCLYTPMCGVTTKSYGSERKAIKEMKEHLKIHLEEAKNYPFSSITPRSSAEESSTECPEFSDSSDNSERSLHTFETAPEDSPVNLCEGFETFEERIDGIVKRNDFRRRCTEYFRNVSSASKCDHNYLIKERIEQLTGEFSEGLTKNFGISLDPALLSNIEPSPQSDDPCLQSDEPSDPPVIVQPQFIITTPAVPYVHGTACFDVARIEELNADGTSVNATRAQFKECSVHYHCNGDEKQCNKKDIKGKDRHPKSTRKRKVPGSVLGCVENQVNFKMEKESPAPRNEVNPDESSENSENLLKIERRIAHRLISQIKGLKTRGEPLKCVSCVDKIFNDSQDLAHHYQRHARLKRYSCSICPQQFTRQHSLKYHLSVHENVYRFTCHICKHGFRHPSHFKLHVLKHSGKVSYECADCHSLFATRSTYKRHLRTKHNKLLTINNEVVGLKKSQEQGN